MNRNPNSNEGDISKFFNDPEKVTKALQAGIQAALLRHKKWAILFVYHVMVKLFGFHQNKFR